MNMPEIKSGLDAPIRNGAGTPAKYPFTLMEVGDHVYFAVLENVTRVRLAAHAVGRYKGWKFVTRGCDGGLTVWRTK
jgi:hypothetical protein